MHALRSKSKSVPSNILNHAPQQAASTVEASTAKVQEVLEGLGINIKVLVESFTKVLVESFTKGEPLNLMSPLLTRICGRLNLLPLTEIILDAPSTTTTVNISRPLTMRMTTALYGSVNS